MNDYCVTHSVDIGILPCPYPGCAPSNMYFVQDTASMSYVDKSNESKLYTDTIPNLLKYSRWSYICQKCNKNLWQWVSEKVNYKTVSLPVHNCVSKLGTPEHQIHQYLNGTFSGSSPDVLFNMPVFNTKEYKFNLTPFDEDLLHSMGIAVFGEMG